MKFIDPMPINCNECGKQSLYPVADLLSFNANCNKCGKNIKQIGIEMNDTLRENRIHLWPMLFLWEAFDIFELNFNTVSDEDFDSIVTINDFINLVNRTNEKTKNIHNRIINMDIMKSIKNDLRIESLGSKKLEDLALQCNPRIESG